MKKLIAYNSNSEHIELFVTEEVYEQLLNLYNMFLGKYITINDEYLATSININSKLIINSLFNNTICNYSLVENKLFVEICTINEFKHYICNL